ncbi:hypothetical protein EDD93_4925 [Streptomyces sp. 840.1]|nr:hypothetical protein EDD93_4925 [Streptomyces sp. 840.1]
MDAPRMPAGSGGRTMEAGGDARAALCLRTSGLHPPVTRRPHPTNSLISYLR